MGKFKEMYINYLNLDKEKRECIKGYSKEYIYDVNNKRLLLSQYILMSKKYIYEIKATEGTAHLWTWSDFKDEAKTEGNIIISQLMEFNKEIDLEILNKYNLEIIQRLN